MQRLEVNCAVRHIYIYIYIYIYVCVCVCVCVSLGGKGLRFPDFLTTAQDVGKVVSLTYRPPLPPGNTPGTHFY